MSRTRVPAFGWVGCYGAAQRAGKVDEAEQDGSAALVAHLQAPVATSHASDRAATYR